MDKWKLSRQSVYNNFTRIMGLLFTPNPRFFRDFVWTQVTVYLLKISILQNAVPILSNTDYYTPNRCLLYSSNLTNSK